MARIGEASLFIIHELPQRGGIYHQYATIAAFHPAKLLELLQDAIDLAAGRARHFA